MPSSRKPVKLLWLLPPGIAFISGSIYFIQGGFGGGHGAYDRLLVFLGLPWSLFPLPGLFSRSDLIGLIILPFVFNSLLVTLLNLWFRKVRQ